MLKQKDTLTTQEAAKMCGVTTVTILRWIKMGFFPGAWKGLGKTSPFHIPREEVERFIAHMAEAEEEEKKKKKKDILPAATEGIRWPQRTSALSRLDQPSQHMLLAALRETLQRLEVQHEKRAPFALIVEDDPDTGEIFEFALRAAGFSSTVVSSGEKALRWLASLTPDILVLDLQLPDMPGTDILKHIRASSQFDGLPVIVATAYPDMAESIKNEANLILLKPIRYSVLQNKAVELARAETGTPVETLEQESRG